MNQHPIRSRVYALAISAVVTAAAAAYTNSQANIDSHVVEHVFKQPGETKVTSALMRDRVKLGHDRFYIQEFAKELPFQLKEGMRLLYINPSHLGTRILNFRGQTPQGEQLEVSTHSYTIRRKLDTSPTTVTANLRLGPFTE